MTETEAIFAGARAALEKARGKHQAACASAPSQADKDVFSRRLAVIETAVDGLVELQAEINRESANAN
jgi:hypothetical protein